MTWTLRAILIIASLLTLIVLLRSIRRSKMRVDDAVFWVLFSLMLIIFAIFPRIIYSIARITGAMSPANIVYLIIIGMLIGKIFTMSIHLSVLESKLSKLAQDSALKELEEK